MRLALDKLGYERPAPRAGARRASRAGCSGIGVASFTEVVGAGKGKDYDIAGLRMFDSAELRVHPTGKAVLKLGVRSRARATRRPSPRSSPRSSASRRRTSTCRRATPTTRRTGSAPTRSRSTPDRRRRHGGDRAQAARQGPRDRRAQARGGARGPRVGDGPLLREGLAGPGRDDPGRRARRLLGPPRRDGGRPRGRALLRPAQHDVPVRHLRGGGGDRPRHRRSGSRCGWSRSTTAACGSTR